jgi:hypothetical protein
MAADQSRLKSLYFLLLVNARKRVLNSSDPLVAREIVKYLEIRELEDFWEISTRVADGAINILREKSNFTFYPTKNESSYGVEPSVSNKYQAELVVNELFQKAGLSHGEIEIADRESFQSLKAALRKYLLTCLLILIGIVGYFTKTRSLIELLMSGISIVYICYSFFGGMKETIKTLHAFFLFILLIAGFFGSAGLEPIFQIYIGIQILLLSLARNKISFAASFVFWILAVLHFSDYDFQSKSKGIGLFLFSLSILLLTAFPSLNRQGRSRPLSLILGLLLFIFGQILFLDLSPQGLVALVFSLLIASMLVLSGSRNSLSKIFIGTGLSLS